MDTITPIKVVRGDDCRAFIPARSLTPSELALFNEYLHASASAQSDYVRDRGDDAWSSSDMDAMCARVVRDMSAMGVALSAKTVSIVIDVSDADGSIAIPAWDCKTCRHRDEPMADSICDTCYMPAGKHYEPVYRKNKNLKGA